MSAASAVVGSIRHNSVRAKLTDALLIAQRNLIRYARIPALLVFSTIQPVMFVLLFRYVFGGAITTPGFKYVDFLIPGIFVQTTVFGSTATGIGLAEDLSKGIIDRFRTLPIARSAVLAGRTLADTVRNLFVVLLMFAVGIAVGFRIHNGILFAIGGVLLTLLFGYAFSWISAAIGLAIADVEATQAATFVWLFPLTFASSAFAPASSMPGWLQAWVKVNPVTATVDSLRALFNKGLPLARPLLHSLAWIAGILIVFGALAVRKYRKIS
jgi:ABC-2 type transport system permease protein/oleandomycin transport system permease protein